MRRGGIRGARALDCCADIARGGRSGVLFFAGVVGNEFLASARPIGLILEEGKALRALAKLSGGLLVARICARSLEASGGVELFARRGKVDACGSCCMRRSGMRRAHMLDFCANIARGGRSGTRFVIWVVDDAFLASAGSIFEDRNVLCAPDELLVLGRRWLVIWGCARYLALL
jgi:hypothetical protein